MVKWILRILGLLIGFLALLSPGTYALLFIFFTDSSAFLLVLFSVAIILMIVSFFRRIGWIAWWASVIIIGMGSSLDYFHEFYDPESSGPVPYEWLDGYAPLGLSFLALSIFYRVLEAALKNKESSEQDVAPNA